MAKLHRATVGERIGVLFLDIIESAYHAYYASVQEKLPIIVTTLKKTETLKLLVTVAWEGKLIQTGHFSQLTDALQEISKMLSGWKRGIEAKRKPE
ncbi:four helix bundle protein [Candidatus Nomurabacteria bacterium]|nr:four helix bundle protein [Candidatus Nomurabacteria bacterium]